MRLLRLLLAIGLTAFPLIACTSGAGTDAASAEPSSGSEQVWGDDWGDEQVAGGEHDAIAMLGISGPDAPWAQMSGDSKEFYMIGKVLPIMQTLFGREDADRWGEYGCESCHGDAMREDAFRMPPASSYRVPAPGTPAWTGMERTFPDTVRFMREVVTPTMATLLGDADFSCHGCHPGPG